MEELFNFFDFQGFGEISHQDLKEVLGQEMACHVAVQAKADAHGVISKAPPGKEDRHLGVNRNRSTSMDID